MAKFAGKYTRTEMENNDAFLNKLGVNYLVRKAVSISTPTLEITEVTPGHWKLVLSTKLKKMELNFELGKAFDEKSIDGRTCKTTITQEGDNRWIAEQVGQKPGEKTVTMIREFSDAGIAVQMICEEVTSKQFFKRD